MLAQDTDFDFDFDPDTDTDADYTYPEGILYYSEGLPPRGYPGKHTKNTRTLKRFHPRNGLDWYNPVESRWDYITLSFFFLIEIEIGIEIGIGIEKTAQKEPAWQEIPIGIAMPIR